MPTMTVCPSCGKQLAVKDEMLGRKVRCPDCKEPFEVQAVEAAPAPTAPEGAAPITRACPECGEGVPLSEQRCPSCGVNYRRAKQRRESPDDQGGVFAPEKKMIAKGVWGGIALIVIAVIWFVAGWVNGYIFYYPPVLAVFGLVGVAKGLANPPATGRRRRR